jgi:mRNA interferase RelE/StbE
MKVHRLVRAFDLPDLPDDLREIFDDVCQSVLVFDPHRCFGLPNHRLKGNLVNYRAIELDWNGVAYRLVYRIYDSPSPRRVMVLSFAEHDPAYERAVERKGQ